jgi:hypothetical protein
MSLQNIGPCLRLCERRYALCWRRPADHCLLAIVGIFLRTLLRCLTRIRIGGDEREQVKTRQHRCRTKPWWCPVRRCSRRTCLCSLKRTSICGALKTSLGVILWDVVDCLRGFYALTFCDPRPRTNRRLGFIPAQSVNCLTVGISAPKRLLWSVSATGHAKDEWQTEQKISVRFFVLVFHKF